MSQGEEALLIAVLLVAVVLYVFTHGAVSAVHPSMA